MKELASLTPEHMKRNARRQSRRLCYKADVHVPDFDTLVPALELSLPIQFCRHVSNGIIFLHPRVKAPEQEQECRNPVNGSFVAETSATLPGVHRHISIFFKCEFRFLNSLKSKMKNSKKMIFMFDTSKEPP